MKKKGFTLLELLAVIIILAVIALIATPVVLNVVDEAKKSAFQDSTYGLIKSGEYYYTSQILNGGMTSDKVFNFPNNTELEFSGTEPKSGYIKVTKDGLVEIAVSNGKYCATKGLNEDKVTIKDYVEGECGIIIQAPTISLNSDILNIVSNDERTEKYEIYVDGELKTTIAAAVADGANVIKAGTYQFNDVLTVPTKFNEDNYLFEEINVIIPQRVTFNLDGEKVSFENVLYTSVEIDVNPLQVYIQNETGDGFGNLGYFWDEEHRWNYVAYAFATAGYAIENAEGYGQIIIIPNDTEVSAVFYEWFTANANQIGVSYDLSSLNLEEGRYRITVKGVADGYQSNKFSNEIEYNVGPQLQSPTISLDNSVLNITPNDENTEEYEIYVDGKFNTTVMVQGAVDDELNTVLPGTYVLPQFSNKDLNSGEFVFVQGSTTYYAISTSYMPNGYSYPHVYYKKTDGEYQTIGSINTGVDYGYRTLKVYETQTVNQTFYDSVIVPATYTPFSECECDDHATDSDNDGFCDVCGGIIPEPIVQTFDLSMLNLAAGSYRITVKAVADGYEDSPESNAVTYEVAGNYVLSGTWKFNDVLSDPSSDLEQEIRFSGTVNLAKSGLGSYDCQFFKIKFYNRVCILGFYLTSFEPNDGCILAELVGDHVSVYSSGWNYPGQTITFAEAQEVSLEFYEWFTANAVKQ